MRLLGALCVLLAGLHPTLASPKEPARPQTGGACSAGQVAGTLEELRARAASGETPSCPTVARCPRRAPAASARSTFIDTGLTACTPIDETVPVVCPAGSTIHLQTQARRDCSCGSGARAHAAGRNGDEIIVGVWCQRYDL